MLSIVGFLDGKALFELDMWGFKFRAAFKWSQFIFLKRS